MRASIYCRGDMKQDVRGCKEKGEEARRGEKRRGGLRVDREREEETKRGERRQIEVLGGQERWEETS